MNFDFYIFEKAISTYSQYVDDDTKNIFQNINIQSKEQLSIHHDDTLVYYIYTRKTVNGYVGFGIVLNGVVYTDFADLFSIFRKLTEEKRYNEKADSNAIDSGLYFYLEDKLKSSFDNTEKFVESGKPIYDSVDENLPNGKTFDGKLILSDDVQYLSKVIDSIRKYKWVYVLLHGNEIIALDKKNAACCGGKQRTFPNVTVTKISDSRESRVNRNENEGTLLIIIIIIIFAVLCNVYGNYVD